MEIQGETQKLRALPTKCSNRLIGSQCKPWEVGGAKEADPGVSSLPIKMCHFFPSFDFAFVLRLKELNACVQKDARTVSAS